MTSQVQLVGNPRAKEAKKIVKSLRKSGRIPGIIYGGAEAPVLCSFDIRDVNKQLETPGFYTRIYDINVEKATYRAMAREVQLHPVTDQPLHIDFLKISKDTKITVSIPVVVINEDKSPGVKMGGIVNLVMHTIEVISTPDKVPDHITIDLSGFNIHDSVHVRDIKLPEGAAFYHLNEEDTIATIVAPKVEKAGGQAEGGSSEESEASS